MGKKHKERVIRLREAEEASLDAYQAQLREANEITGVPGAEMQREQAKDETQWIKDNAYVNSLGQSSEPAKPLEELDRDYERGGPSMKSSFDSGGTSMGSGKLPIGDNVKKSGSQIGKHMNKYGV